MGRFSLLNAIIPIPMAPAPMVISNVAMRTSIIFKDTKPKHTPLAIGIILQNLGSLASSLKSAPVSSKGLSPLLVLPKLKGYS